MDKNGVKLICFEFCGEKFAFNMDYLVEIVQIQSSDITPFYSHIPLLRGKWDYRERTIYVIDLRDLFELENGSGVFPDRNDIGELQEGHTEAAQQEGGPPTTDSLKKSASKSILVVRIRDQLFGLLTDTVLQVAPLTVFYEYPNMISTLPKRYFGGVAIMNAELILILTIEEFVNEYELNILLEEVGSTKEEGKKVRRVEGKPSTS